MRITKFYILNIFALIIEYSVIFFGTYFLLTNQNMIISSSVTGGLFLFLFIIIVLFKRRNPFDSDDITEQDIEDTYGKYHYLIDKANKMGDMSIKLGVTHTKDLQSPAFAMVNTIYVNKAYKVKEQYKAGLIAHELGHVLSGLNRKVYFLNARYSLIIGALLNVIGHRVQYSKIKIIRPITYIAFVLYYVINIVNKLVYFPFLKNDEHLANSFAVALGAGDSLRCYYFDSFSRTDKKLNIFDFAHPSPASMIEQMNLDFGYKENYATDVYAIDNVIKFVTNSASKEEKQIKMFKWYLNIGDPTNSFVQSKLGFMYANGIGTDVDYRASNAWFIKSVKNGVLKDYYYLAKNYQTVGKTDLAIRNYREAALNGVYRAFYDLGILLELNEETMAEAYVMYYEGSINNSKECARKLWNTLKQQVE